LKPKPTGKPVAKPAAKPSGKPAAAPSGKGVIINVDFTGVTTGGGRVHIPEGDYGVKLASIKNKKGTDSGKTYLEAQFTTNQGEKKGLNKKLYHNFSLQKQSLWNLRNFLESCGKTVPSKAVKLNVSNLVGLECACTVVDEDYQGKPKSVISAFFPIDDLGNTSETGEELDEATSGEETEEEATEEVADEEEATEEVEEEAEEASDEEDLFS
jgi:hypothetical protein